MFLYTFQGLADDGSYYVAAVLPVSHPTLPADGTVILDEFDAHVGDVQEQLNTQDASSFTPDLTLLDAMARSLEVQ